MSELEKEKTEPETEKDQEPAQTNAAPVDVHKDDSAASETADSLDETEQEGRAKAILEGLIFIVGDDGISAEQAAETLGVSVERVDQLVEELKNDYSDDSHGFELTQYGGLYRFMSKEFVHPYAAQLFQMGRQATLSQAALETLAIIAYKQPVTRVEIEEIRGVGADVMLRKLMARGLIRESGRSDAPGKPILYEVTEEFMNSFKLMSLKELPELPAFRSDDNEDDGDFLK